MAPSHLQQQQQQQQPSIRSFFQPKQLPKYAAPPSSSSRPAAAVAAPPPPATPPLPLPSETASLPLTNAPPPPRFAPAPSPHPNATIVPIEAHHIPALRRINALLLPVNYTDSFYAAALDPAVSGLLSRVVLWRDDGHDPNQQKQPKVIGGIVCRIDPSPFSPASGSFDARLAGSVAPAASHAVYIQSLGLLAPYRSQGIAAAAVEAVVRDAAALTADPRSGLRIAALYAHVWTENEDGLRWYAARGFARDVVLAGYYFKLRPDTAWIVKRAIGGSPVAATLNGAGYVPPEGMVVPQQAPVAASTTAAAVNLAGFSGAAAVPPPPPLARASSSLSFQNKRPDMEWNDLPEDMVSSSRNSSRSDLLSPPLPNGGGNGGGGAAGPPRSGASSRSSSTAPGRKKKDRSYPAAAFGS